MVPKIYRSSFPDVELPDIDLITFLFSNPSNVSGATPVFVDAVTGTSRTYSDVKKRTQSLAHGLRQLGVQPGDVIAFFSPNTIDYALTFFAVIGCGAILSPVNAGATAVELQAQLQTSGAKYLIAHSSLLSTAKKASESGTSVLRILQADGKIDVDGNPTAETMASTFTAGPLFQIRPEDAETKVAFMCFSSGTTGRAKGVMTTHKNMVSNMKQGEAHLPEIIQQQTHVAFLPFSHIYGLQNYLCTAMLHGSTVVVMQKFDLDVYLANIQKWRPKMLIAVPPVVLLLAKDPRMQKYDLSSVRRLQCAAAPLSVQLREAVEARWRETFGTEFHCIQAWGLTETSPLATGTPWHRIDKKHCVGNIAPNMECRVVDPETMKDVEMGPDGESLPGEIWCRGPNVTIGYYKNEEATSNGFVIDENGRRWFRTGDIGTVDRDGFFKIVDRIKEMIKYKGLQVIPAELEGKLLEHPDIDDACVVGVWAEEQATELPVAFVVAKKSVRGKGDEVLIREVNRWFNERVANYKKLRGGIYLVDVIPKSPSGKILRRQLKDTLKTSRAVKL